MTRALMPAFRRHARYLLDEFLSDVRSGYAVLWNAFKHTVSGAELAAAACVGGLVGSLTRNHCRDIAELEAQLRAVAERVARFREAS